MVKYHMPLNYTIFKNIHNFKTLFFIFCKTLFMNLKFETIYVDISYNGQTVKSIFLNFQAKNNLLVKLFWEIHKISVFLGPLKNKMLFQIYQDL